MKVILNNFMKSMNSSVRAFDDQGNELEMIVADDGEGNIELHIADFDPIRDMIEFHTKFGLEYNGKPRALPPELAHFRVTFLREELDEYNLHRHAAAGEVAQALVDQASYAYHLENMLDALVDEVYVAIGTAYLHGFNFREAWRRVHEANMKKVRAERAEDSKRGSTFDVVKPPGWQPPSHIDLVEDHDLRKS